MKIPSSEKIFSNDNKSLGIMIDSNSYTLSQEIVQNLLSLGLPKQAIADSINSSVSTVNNILQGKVKTPNHRTFAKLLSLYCSTQVS